MLSQAGRALARGQVRAALRHTGAAAHSAVASVSATPATAVVAAKVAALLSKVRG